MLRLGLGIIAFQLTVICRSYTSNDGLIVSSAVVESPMIYQSGGNHLEVESDEAGRLKRRDRMMYRRLGCLAFEPRLP